MVYKRILLIDDDEEDGELFTDAMRDVSDAAIITVINNAVEALKKLRAGELIADLIFLDLNMPLMKGEEFLTEIRKNKELKDIQVVILTTSADPRMIKTTQELGAIQFITKPSSYDELVNVLQSLLASIQ